MERLLITGKVWGVVKYYNPVVGKGTVDWDSVLIVTLKKVKNVTNDQEFYEIIDELIIPTEFGNMDNISTDSVKIFLSNNNIDWIENRGKLPDSIRYKLKLLIDNKYSYKNYYVDYDTNTGNVTFYNEKSYSHLISPTVEYRLLGLFRYWNAINYFYPYKYIIGREWDEILYEYMPLFIQANDTLSYHLTVLSLATELNDSHAITYSKTLQKYWGYFDLPFITRTIEGKTVITDFYSDSLADLYGLKRGDIITKFNDSSIQVMKSHFMKHIIGSNNTAKEKNINYFLWGGTNDQDTVCLEIIRDAQKFKISLKRYEMKYLLHLFKTSKTQQQPWQLMDNNIGFIDLGELRLKDVDSAMFTLINTKALILDIRKRPKYTLYAISNYLNKEKVNFASFLLPFQQLPGIFYFDTNYYVGPENINANYYKGEVILLINENTYSHGEFTCMALQTAPNVVLIGSNTAGADGNVSKIKFPGGITTFFSGLGVYYPNGKQTQRIGIRPDIEVSPTINGVRSGEDELLNAALKYLKQ